MGKIRNAYTVSVGKSDGKMSPGRHRCSRKDNIKMDFKK
jgi:hypothetical protein